MAKKIFISYKYTGEDRAKLESNIGAIREGLKDSGHNVYCTLWDSNIQAQSKRVLFDYAFKEIDKSDIVLVAVFVEEKSEGMLMEIGYAFAKKKRVILLIDKNVKNTHLRDLIDEKYDFSNSNQIREIIGRIK